MLLYFLRHAIAVERGDPKYKNDSLRPLTTEGRKKMLGACLGMQHLGLKFDVLLSSPYVRARQTAEIITQNCSLKNKTIHLTNNLLPPASAASLLKEIYSLYPKSRNILVVGHEPHLTEMISSLLKSNQALNINFKKGGLCSLSIHQSSAVMNWLLTPKQLNLLNPNLKFIK